MVSVKKAYSHVSGSQGNDKKYNSHTTVVLEGVNILDVVTADRIVARLTSEHDPDPKLREGHIIALGTKFENLRISGCPVEVEFDHELFLKNKTFAALSKNLAALKKSGRMAEPGFKRISMLRLQLGSPHDGLLNTAEASLNGTHWP
jgi:hypothetical protein